MFFLKAKATCRVCTYKKTHRNVLIYFSKATEKLGFEHKTLNSVEYGVATAVTTFFCLEIYGVPFYAWDGRGLGTALLRHPATRQLYPLHQCAVNIVMFCYTLVIVLKKDLCPAVGYDLKAVVVMIVRNKFHLNIFSFPCYYLVLYSRRHVT